MNLKRDVSLSGVFSLAVGAMISSGIFILPSYAFALSGPSAIISYAIAGFLALIGSFGMIELATAMPKSGGDYFFINRSLGPLVGTFTGILGWLALSLKSSFAVYGLSKVVEILFGVQPLLVATIGITVFVLLNLKGAKEAAKLQLALVVILLTLLVGFVVFSIPKVDTTHYVPFFKGDVTTMLITSGFVFISFGGLLKVANIAEEIKDPKKNIPLGVISSIIVVTILYSLVMFVLTGLLTPENLKNSAAPVADAARQSFGNPGFIAMTIASTLAFVTTANAGILAASRYPMSLARDGLLPPFFVKMNKRGMPIVAIVLTGILMWGTLLLDLNSLVKAASSVILASYVLTNVSVMVLRESHLVSYMPTFKSPLYPWLNIACVLIFSYFIVELGSLTIGATVTILIAGALLYFFYGRHHNNSEYALLHLLRRIADESLTQGLLEKELEEIVTERDSRESYYVDLLKRAKAYDIEDALTFEQLIQKACDDGIISIKCDKKELEHRFVEREKEATTQLNSFIAIPHLIIDNMKEMQMIVIRSKKGVSFSNDKLPAKAVVILFGPLKAREDHLIAMSHIAKVARGKDFKEKWLSDTIEDLIPDIFES